MNIPEITLRDYFAAQIIGHLAFDELQGDREGHYWQPSKEAIELHGEPEEWGLRLSRRAYYLADCMLAMRQEAAQ